MPCHPLMNLFSGKNSNTKLAIQGGIKKLVLNRKFHVIYSSTIYNINRSHEIRKNDIAEE